MRSSASVPGRPSSAVRKADGVHVRVVPEEEVEEHAIAVAAFS
jgi:hypothetical protein